MFGPKIKHLNHIVGGGGGGDMVDVGWTCMQRHSQCKKYQCIGFLLDSNLYPTIVFHQSENYLLKCQAEVNQHAQKSKTLTSQQYRVRTPCSCHLPDHVLGPPSLLTYTSQLLVNCFLLGSSVYTKLFDFTFPCFTTMAGVDLNVILVMFDTSWNSISPSQQSIVFCHCFT